MRHWLAPDDSVFHSDAGSVEAAELCLTRASSDCAPFRSEYEGYMGNYGNTVDRWYHRAAVVMWPRERAFVIRARQAPRWAIGRIAEKLETGDTAQAQTWVQTLLPVWGHATRDTEDAGLLAAVLPVAAALDDEDTAARLLAPFSLRQLAPEMTPWLLRLLERHGLAWCRARLRQWAARHPPPSDHLDWLAHTLPALTQACAGTETPQGKAWAACLAEDGWHGLQAHLAQVDMHHAGSSRARALADAGPALLGLLCGSRDAHRPDLRQAIIDALKSADPRLSLGVLRAAIMTPLALPGLGLASLHTHCMRTLALQLAQPERTADDWSITVSARPAGELGNVLGAFLESPGENRLEWPLAKEKRQIIHRFIEFHELPLRHQTRRAGRPYTLVLEKTRNLFEQETIERRQWARDLSWLRETADRFAAS